MSEVALAEVPVEEESEVTEEVLEEVIEESEEENIEEDPEGGGEEGGDSSDLIVSIGEGDSPPRDDKDPDLPSHLRSEIKERNKKLREKDETINELKQKLSVLQGTAGEQAISAPGPKPNIDDFIDSTEYAVALDKWHDDKRAYETVENKRKERIAAETKAWENTLDMHKEKAAVIRTKVKGYDEAEETVKSVLNETQLGAILHCANDSALLIAGLGSNPGELERMAAITDPSKYIYELGKMETKLKTTPRKPVTQPEKRVTGTASLSGGIDKKLEQLEKEAEKTGNRSKIIKYKKELKNKRS